MNLDSTYVIWQPVELTRAYHVLRFDDAFLKRQTGSLAGIWPSGAFCVLDCERGMKDAFLPDSLRNPGRRLIVSPRLKDSLVRAGVTDTEYWQIKIIDRTGRPLGEPYFYVHFLNAPECLDLEASGATRSRILPKIAEKVERLEFQSDPKRELFRPRELNAVVLVSWALADTLANEGFSGFRWMGLFDYGISGDLPPNPKRQPVDVLCAKLSRQNRARPAI